MKYRSMKKEKKKGNKEKCVKKIKNKGSSDFRVGEFRDGDIRQ